MKIFIYSFIVLIFIILIFIPGGRLTLTEDEVEQLTNDKEKTVLNKDKHNNNNNNNANFFNDINKMDVGVETQIQDEIEEEEKEIDKLQLLPYCKTKKVKINDNDSSNETQDQIKKVSYSKKLILATMDGQLTVLDNYGRVSWSFCTGLLFSSTLSSITLNENGKLVNMIPSLSGRLYRFDGEELRPLPLNAEALLRKSFKVSSDVVISGGKEMKTFGLDISTGDKRYECGLDGCSTPVEDELGSANNKSKLVLVVKKQIQTVRAISSMSGEEKWNFSVGTHELALAGVQQGCYEGEQKEIDYENQIYFKFSNRDGVVYGGSGTGENSEIEDAQWKHQFQSPISQAWLLDEETGSIINIDPIGSSSIYKSSSSSAFYIGVHKHQMYVQEAHTTNERLDKLKIDDTNSSKENKNALQIGWKMNYVDNDLDMTNPDKALVPIESTTTTTTFPNSKTLTTTKFNGVYIFESDELPIVEFGNETVDDDKDSRHSKESLRDSDGDDDDEFDDGPIQIIIVSLWFWWKEVLGISLLTAVLLNILLMRPIVRAVRTQTIRDIVEAIRNLRFRNAFKKDKREQRKFEDSDTGNGPLLPLPVPSSSSISLRKRSSSTNSQCNTDLDDLGFQNNFVSQYLNEFDPIQCLGKGGFGIVFEAKKKIDERSYAVKRIPLPNKKKSRERVMREVKSLAKLEHRNIVRYFSAWIESPPPQWLEQNDPLFSKCNLTDSMSMNTSPVADIDNSSYIASFSVANRKQMKKKNNKLSFDSSLPPRNGIKSYNNNNEDEDSFIVFERTEMSNVEESNVMNASCALSLDMPLTSSEDEREGKRDKATDSQLPASVMYLYIQQELCQKKTLQDWLRLTAYPNRVNSDDNQIYPKRNYEVVKNFFSDIVDAVEYIHGNSFIHRDLKPSNIFLANANDSSNTIILKIGDFGLATTTRVDSFESLNSDFSNSKDLNSIMTGRVGTKLYMSPEQSKNRPYDYKVDIYSLGLIFFELLVPFSTDMERYDVLSRVRKSSFPQDFNNSFPTQFKLIEKMVSHDPKVRPDIKEIRLKISQEL